MPTVLRSGPYRFFFYSADRGEPPHVHVEHQSKIAKIWIDPVRVADGGGLRGDVGRNGPAPGVNLPALDGGSRDLTQERGKVVLLNFWATWCIPCRTEMPELQGLTPTICGET